MGGLGPRKETYRERNGGKKKHGGAEFRDESIPHTIDNIHYFIHRQHAITHVPSTAHSFSGVSRGVRTKDVTVMRKIEGKLP